MKFVVSMILLSALMLSSVSCGDKPKPSSDYTSADPSAPVGNTLFDRLPTERFGGETFTVLGRTYYSYEFEAEEQNGDLLMDAVYNRNIAVEERFDIHIETVMEPCSWGTQATEFNTKIRSSVMSGDGAFDLVAGYAATIPEIVGDGLFLNWHEIPYITPDAAWWSANVAEELTINGKAFMITGDISLALWRNMNCILYNKQLTESFDIAEGELYKMVKDGTWTFDTLMELTADRYKDLNGDSTPSPEDQYGFICRETTSTEMFLDAFSLKTTVKGDDGFPQFNYQSEKLIDFIPRFNAYIHESGSVFFPYGKSDTLNLCKNMFTEGRALFYAGIFNHIEEFRGMEDDFGILPYPKYNGEQTEYYSTSMDEFSVFLVPLDVKNAAMTGLITEAMCIYNHENVIPVYYDIVMKDKMSRDETSKEMIDLIRDSLTFDFGYLCNKALDGGGKLFIDLIRNNNNNIVSKYDSGKAAYNEKLQKALEIYR